MHMRQRRRPTEPAQRPQAPAEVASLSAVPRSESLIRVHFSDGARLDLPAEVIVAEGLASGVVVEEEHLQRLILQAEAADATRAALALLSYRPRAEAELRRELKKRGHGPEAIDATMVKLREWRYVDDADFAQRWVESRSASKPRSQRMLENELRKKGVEREVIRETIDAADLDDRAQAERLAAARWPKLVGEEPQAAKRKLAAYLARRGFSHDAVRFALTRVTADDSGEEIPEE